MGFPDWRARETRCEILTQLEAQKARRTGSEEAAKKAPPTHSTPKSVQETRREG